MFKLMPRPAAFVALMIAALALPACSAEGAGDEPLDLDLDPELDLGPSPGLEAQGCNTGDDHGAVSGCLNFCSIDYTMCTGVYCSQASQCPDGPSQECNNWMTICEDECEMTYYQCLGLCYRFYC